MIHIRFKLFSVIIALIAAYFIVSPAHAYSVDPITVNGDELVTVTTETSEFAISYRQNNGGARQFWIENETQTFPFSLLGDGSIDGTIPVVFFSIESTFLNCQNLTYLACVNDPLNQPGIMDTISINFIENQTWGAAGLFGDNVEPLDLAAAVAGGVQDTGLAIWPLFAFVGIALAFAIALQIVIFTKRSVAGSNAVIDEKTPDIGNSGPIGDEIAYKRGRKLIEKEIPGFYKD